MRGFLIRGRAGQNWGSRAQYHRLAVSADQVEWRAVLDGSAHVMAGTMDEEMAEEADQDLSDDIRSSDILEGKSKVLEHTQGQTTELIVERIEQLGDAYPFEHTANSLRYKGTTNELPLYELLLGISRAHSLTTGQFKELPRIFEQLSRLAGMAFLGPAADGFHTGWPRPKTHVRFKSVIDTLRKNSGEFSSEWQWQPNCDLPDDPLPALIKDGGMDIVAWRPWADRRGAHLYMLGQCACGADWLEKTNDLKLERLREWFCPPRVAPLRSFFTPHYAVKHLLYHHSLEAGLMFDRARMVHMLREPHIRSHVVALENDIRKALAIAKQELPNSPKNGSQAAEKTVNHKRSAALRRRP